MLNDLKNINQLRKQAKRMKEELSKELLIGTAEGGKVQITMDGNQEVREVRIEPDILTLESKQKVEAAIKEAITQCNTQLQMMMAKKMQNGDLF